jgi:hypothetical protein
VEERFARLLLTRGFVQLGVVGPQFSRISPKVGEMEAM